MLYQIKSLFRNLLIQGRNFSHKQLWTNQARCEHLRLLILKIYSIQTLKNQILISTTQTRHKKFWKEKASHNQKFYPVLLIQNLVKLYLASLVVYKLKWMHFVHLIHKRLLKNSKKLKIFETQITDKNFNCFMKKMGLKKSNHLCSLRWSKEKKRQKEIILKEFKNLIPLHKI